MEPLPTYPDKNRRRIPPGPSIRSRMGHSRFSFRVSLNERGFSLLELLVVLFIIGIIVSVAGLSISQRTGRLAQDEAERLYGLVRVAGEEAILQGRELAVEFTSDGYRFLELDNDNQWGPIVEDTLFRERKIPPEIKIELLLEGAPASFDDEKNLPRIFVLSSGELSAFELSLSVEDQTPYILEGAIDGELNLMQKDEKNFDG